jgi:histidine triad (HIT) family protein
MTDTVFGKMVRGEIPVQPVYEDEHCIAINDIHPQAPVHVLIIPRQSLAKLSDATADHAELLGRLLLAAGNVARQLGVDDGFRLIVNNGAEGGQTVFHLHVHLLAGRTLAEGSLVG